MTHSRNPKLDVAKLGSTRRGLQAGLFLAVAALRQTPCLAAIGLLWWLALENGLGGDFFYDEAVYANLSLHPFITDYYFDPIFFRHPPFSYCFNCLLGLIFGSERAELTYRVSSLVFTSLGLVLLWMTLGLLIKSWLLRSFAVISLACSPLFVRYGLSATMYPHFFAWLLLTLYGLVSRRPSIEKAGFLALAYTHYVERVG